MKAKSFLLFIFWLLWALVLNLDRDKSLFFVLLGKFNQLKLKRMVLFEVFFIGWCVTSESSL